METMLHAETEKRGDHAYRFSTEDFHWMAKAGVFPPDARVELLEGQVKTMSPIGPFHGGVTDILAEYFWELSQKRWVVRAQNPVQLMVDSEPQPDIVLARPVRHRYKLRHPAPEDIFLIIEVSDTTHAFDLTKKLPLYAEAGIPEVWILDLNELVFEIFREPNGSEYASLTKIRPGDFAGMAAFPDVKVDVAEVFRWVD